MLFRSVSTGIRFTTLPDATPPSFQVPASSAGPSTPRGPPSQPPTTITALFNPMLGHISGAYAARVSRDLSLASRFDFNVYSYESEWSLGAEWWQRRGKARHPPSSDDESHSSLPELADEVQGVVKAKVSTTTVRDCTPQTTSLMILSISWDCRTSRCCGKGGYGMFSLALGWYLTSQAVQNPSSP